jgi:hypothetical protein
MWATFGPLDPKLTHYHEIDYLLDGLVEQEFQKQAQGPHLFSSMSFGHAFLVGHLVLGTNDFMKKTEDLLRIMSGITVHSPKVCILTDDKDLLLKMKQTAAKFPAITLKSL